MAAKKKAEETANTPAETEEAGLPVETEMDFLNDEDLGGGMEDADKESFAIPFLRVIQKMSPEVDEADAKYIPDAKPGMFLNTVTEELYDGKEGVVFLPCYYQRRFIRWGARGTDQEGFKGEYLPEDVAAMRQAGEIQQDDEGKLLVPNENGELDDRKCDLFKDTRNHFGLLVDPNTGGMQQVLLSLSSTQIKKSKQLMSQLSNAKVKTAKGLQTPPTWVNRILLTTVPESNDSGSWHGVKPSPQGFISDKETYQAGKDFHDLIAAGEAKVNYSEAAPENSTDESF